MKFTRTLIGIATGLALAQGAAAIDLSNDDQRFLRKAGESGMLEMQASELAVQKAENPEVKRYAEMMIKDHAAVDKELKVLAQRKGFQLPVELEGGKLRLMENLRQLDGAAFDEEYADEVAVDAHEDTVELFEDAAEDADDDEVRAFAAKHLPALKNHLEMGHKLEDLVADARRNAASTPDAAAAGPAGQPVVPETRR